jgi:hypothetical protein
MDKDGSKGESTSQDFIVWRRLKEQLTPYMAEKIMCLEVDQQQV